MRVEADNVERLLLLVIEKFGIEGSLNDALSKAEKVLEGMTLTIILGDEILNNINLQSGLSGVINSAKRAFKGGIQIVNAESYGNLKLPGYINSTLRDLINDGTVSSIDFTAVKSPTICIGCTSYKKGQIELKANSWQGGIVPFGHEAQLSKSGNFVLAGNFAAGMAVAYCFMHEIGILRELNQPIGLSLWRPDLFWLDEKAIGPDIHYLPDKYWLVGLGHLGQAFQWVMTQFPKRESVEVTLQDFDRIDEANYSAGLISEKSLAGQKKTRVSSVFLEAHGYQTRIIERAFDKTIQFSSEEDPAIVLCGVDNAKARREMDQEAFPMFIDSGLGGSLATFDSMSIQNFKFKKRTTDDFKEAQYETILGAVEKIEVEIEKSGCGILSRKAISSSFIGLINASLVLSEVVRAFNSGMAFKAIDFSLRDPDDLIVEEAGKSYDTELLKYGRIEIK